jgi:hypothetical protein
VLVDGVVEELLSLSLLPHPLKTDAVPINKAEAAAMLRNFLFILSPVKIIID